MLAKLAPRVCWYCCLWKKSVNMAQIVHWIPRKVVLAADCWQPQLMRDWAGWKVSTGYFNFSESRNLACADTLHYVIVLGGATET